MLNALVALAFAAAVHAGQMHAQADAYEAQLATLQAEAVQMEAERDALRVELDALQAEADGLRAELEAAPACMAPASIECGACGAHVLEWWYLAPYAPNGELDPYGEPVAVCHDCYTAAVN